MVTKMLPGSKKISDPLKPTKLSRAALGFFSAIRLASLLYLPDDKQVAKAITVEGYNNLPVQLAQCYGNCYTDTLEFNPDDICFSEEPICDGCYHNCYDNCYGNWSNDCHSNWTTDWSSACVGPGGEEECDPDLDPDCEPDTGGA